MSNKKQSFTPIKLGTLVDEQNQFTKSVEAKQRLLSELFDYMNQFVSIEDKSAFKGDIYGTFLNKFLDKNSASFPPGININKLMDLMGVDTAKLNFLIAKVEEIKIDFDFETNEPLDIPDFNIYTESNEQNNLYNYAQKVIQVYKESKDFDMTIYPADIVASFRGLLFYDWSTNEIAPNTYFIQGKMIRTY